MVMPIPPPTRDSKVDSARNCFSMSVRRAPMLLRMPISLVRSETLTSMIFMMTMPPTTSEIDVIPTAAIWIVPKILSRSSLIALGVMIPKLSFSAGDNFRRVRMTTRASSTASR